jgi:hypothetical protein
LQRRQPFWLLIALILVVKLVIAQPQIALFSGISTYLISGPIWWIARRMRRWRRREPLHLAEPARAAASAPPAEH